MQFFASYQIFGSYKHRPYSFLISNIIGNLQSVVEYFLSSLKLRQHYKNSPLMKKYRSLGLILS